MNNINPLENYQTNGYFVWRNLVSSELIDVLLGNYHSEVLPSKRFFVRQDSGKWQTNQINEFGHLKNPLGDPHDVLSEFKFGQCLRNLLCGQEIHLALSAVAGYKEFRFIQSMFYDCNGNSPAHTDNLYLDTVPNGHLVGIWIALEDIHVDAGRFYVMPGSNRFEFEIQKVNPTSLYVSEIEDYALKNADKIEAPALRKGDVVFWNSKTVHGSLPTRNAQYSRKSVTAHFAPVGYSLGNLTDIFDESKFTFVNHLGVQMRVGTHKCPYPQADNFADLQEFIKIYVDSNTKVLEQHEVIFADLQADIKRLQNAVTNKGLIGNIRTLMSKIISGK